MMHVVWVEFVIKPDYVSRFTDLIKANARASLQEEQCFQFDVCVDPNRPERIALYEIYADEAAFQLHLQTNHFIAFNQVTAEWVEEKRLATFNRLPL